MKLRYIIASLLAGAALFTACVEEADHFLSEVKVDKSFIGFPKEGGSKTIEMTTTDSWTVQIAEADAEWLSVSPASGAAGEQKLTVTAVAGNDGHETTFNIVCAGKTQVVKVTQEAGEKQETPITPIADVLAAGAGTFRCKGVVTAIANTQYGNFYIEDATGTLYIYGVKDAKGYPKDDPSGWTRFGIEAGDEVVVEGPFKWYGDTPEFVDAEVISVKKSLIDVDAFPFTELPPIDTTFNMVVKAKESPLLLSSNADWLQLVAVNPDGSYQLHADANERTAKRTANISIKGPTAIKSVEIVQAGVPASGASVSDIIAMEDGSAVQTLQSSTVVAKTAKGLVLSDGAKAIYVYDGAGLLADVKLGSNVQINASKTTYNGVPELTDVTGFFVDSEGNAVSHPEAKDITAEAGTYAASEAEYIKLTGTLSISGNYYNLALDAFEDGSKQGSIVAPLDDLGLAAYDGKKITVTGYFNGLSSKGKYINVIVTKFVEFAENPKGTVTNPYCPSEIAALILGGNVPEENVYVKGKVSAILFDFSTYNGTGTFWLSDDGTAYGISEDKKKTTEPAKDFECYGVYWFNNTNWLEGMAQVEIGDEVVVYGNVCYYANGNVAETVNKKAHLYSVNGAVSDAHGLGNTVAPFDVTGAVEFIDRMEEANAAAKAADQAAPTFPDVCVKGKISTIVYTFTADYGTATFWMSDDGKSYGVADDMKSTTEPKKDFECYSIYWHGPDNKWAEGNPQIAAGDEVVIKGQLTYYAAKGIYETSSKKAWLYSLNGATE
ncbi:MAG: BACON domain-containing protein [Bacteroidales bacterium]|nr:BACON domain-containing protein [Bacteroidales bacterium]